MQHEATPSAALTSRPCPEYNKSHAVLWRYNNLFIVMATGEDCDTALVSELLGNDVDSVVKDLVLWEQDVTKTPSEFPNDLPELFGDDADVVLEELKFLHTQSVDSIFEDSDSPPHKQAKISANPTSSKVQRFPPPTLSPERVAAAHGVVPRNTSSNTQ